MSHRPSDPPFSPHSTQRRTILRLLLLAAPLGAVWLGSVQAYWYLEV
jgi:hypothetical protein